MTSKPSTAILVREAQQGEEVAVNELIGKIRPWVRRQAEMLIRKGGIGCVDASDIAQEVCLRATVNFTEFRGAEVAELLAWISRILRNYLIDAARRDRAGVRNRDRESPLDGYVATLHEQQLSPQQQALRDESSLIVVAAMERLPQHQQDVLRYRFFEQLSFSEIATQLGKSEKNCGVICLRALRRLRSELGEP